MSMAPAERHWTREPYVWLVILFPATAVVAGVITIILAVQSDDGLVVDDYYKRGLAINRTLDRDAAARGAGLVLDAIEIESADELIVTISAPASFSLPEQLHGITAHATRKGYDRALTLSRRADGRYRVQGLSLIVGRWYLEVGTPAWRLSKSFVQPTVRP